MFQKARRHPFLATVGITSLCGLGVGAYDVLVWAPVPPDDHGNSENKLHAIALEGYAYAMIFDAIASALYSVAWLVSRPFRR